MESQIELLLTLHGLEIAGNGQYPSEEFRMVEDSLDPPYLEYYRKIRKRRGTGVAILKDRTCSECRMVYPEAHSIVQCKDFIHKCEYCGRLLVASRSIEPPKPHSEMTFVASPVLEKGDLDPVVAVSHSEPAEDDIGPMSDSENFRETHATILANLEKERRVILHVDDDQGYRKLVRREIEAAGFAVVEAGNGTEALEKLTMQKIGLVISELIMPVCDGFKMMEEISKRRMDIPVIFATSFHDDESYLNIMCLGAYDCIGKMDGKEELLRIVRDAMNSQVENAKGDSNDWKHATNTSG
jgi:CheY-like chemotaxis protein